MSFQQVPRAKAKLALVSNHHPNELDESGDGADDDAGHNQPMLMEEVVAVFAKQPAYENGSREDKGDFGIAGRSHGRVLQFVGVSIVLRHGEKA